MSADENVDKAITGVRRLVASLASALPTDTVVFGSAAVVLHGVDLGRAIDDVDFFVSSAAYDVLKRHPLCRETVVKPGVSALHVDGCPEVEILDVFPGVTHAEVLAHAVALPQVPEVKLAALPDLCAWKRAQGRRKDIADLARMEDAARTTGAIQEHQDKAGIGVHAPGHTEAH